MNINPSAIRAQPPELQAEYANWFMQHMPSLYKAALAKMSGARMQVVNSGSGMSGLGFDWTSLFTNVANVADTVASTSAAAKEQQAATQLQIAQLQASKPPLTTAQLTTAIPGAITTATTTSSSILQSPWLWVGLGVAGLGIFFLISRRRRR